VISNCGKNDRFVCYSFLISILVIDSHLNIDFAPPSWPDQAHQHPSRESAQRESLSAVQDSTRLCSICFLFRGEQRKKRSPCARGSRCLPVLPGWVHSLAKVSFAWISRPGRNLNDRERASAASTRFAFLDERNVLSLPARGGKSAQLKLSKRFTSRRSRERERERERRTRFQGSRERASPSRRAIPIKPLEAYLRDHGRQLTRA